MKKTTNIPEILSPAEAVQKIISVCIGSVTDEKLFKQLAFLDKFAKSEAFDSSKVTDFALAFDSKKCKGDVKLARDLLIGFRHGPIPLSIQESQVFGFEIIGR